MKLRRDTPQNIATDRIQFPVGPEKSNDSFFFLKRLNGPVQQNAIKASVMETDVTLVVLVECVHGWICFQFSHARQQKSTNA